MWEGLGWYLFFFSCICSFFVGALSVVIYIASKQAERLLYNAPLQPTAHATNLPQKTVTPQTRNLSVGSPCVDKELEKVVELCWRDYVQSWYHPFVSGSVDLFNEARSLIAQVLLDIGKRCQEPELLPLFMEALVTVLIEHFRLYKGALLHVTPDKDVEKCIDECDNEGWSLICGGGEPELAYIRGATEYILRLALPSEDFSNPLFRSLAQDLLSEHVLLPTARYVAKPIFFNSTIISLTSDASLNGESLLIALTCATSQEVAITLGMIAEEIDNLKKTGKTESDQLQLNSLNELKNHLSQIQESGLRELDEEKYKEKFPALQVSIPEYKIVTEGRSKHVDYKISVTCQHIQGPQEEWITWRRFSDLHDLHLKLKIKTNDPLPTLPSQTKAFNKLEPGFLETKKLRIQNYLQHISSQEFLNAHPNSFGDIILFLTESAYIRQTTEITRTVNKLVQPFKRTSTIKSSSPVTFRKVSEDIEDESEEEDGLVILLTLLDEVFDVSDQWLQRQLSNLLRQLLGSILSDKMGKRIMEAFDNYATGERIADLISQLRISLWPNDYPAQEREPFSQEKLYLSSLLSRTKLIGSVPDDLKRLLGADTTNKGIIRLFDMFQHESLNLRLLYRLVELLLCSLYPERDLNQGFAYLRTQIKQKYSNLK